jgi:hypothetical protein
MAAAMPRPLLRRLPLLFLLAATPLLAEDAAPVTQEAPLPEKIPSPPSEESAPTVSIRQVDNGDTVEEYRQNGRLTMVKVTPPRGAPYMLLDSNGDGRLDRKDAEGPVAPIYWTLYEWD